MDFEQLFRVLLGASLRISAGKNRKVRACRHKWTQRGRAAKGGTHVLRPL